MVPRAAAARARGPGPGGRARDDPEAWTSVNGRRGGGRGGLVASSCRFAAVGAGPGRRLGPSPRAKGAGAGACGRAAGSGRESGAQARVKRLPGPQARATAPAPRRRCWDLTDPTTPSSLPSFPPFHSSHFFLSRPYRPPYPGGGRPKAPGQLGPGPRRQESGAPPIRPHGLMPPSLPPLPSLSLSDSGAPVIRPHGLAPPAEGGRGKRDVDRVLAPSLQGGAARPVARGREPRRHAAGRAWTPLG